MHVRAVLQSKLKEMSPAEAEVVRRLLRNPAQVAELSLREVAARCHTSDATVMRACRAAGYDGFQHLKYHVLREYTSGKAPSIPSGIGTYATDVSASLEAAEASLDRAAQLLHHARRVALVGVGASYGVAVIALDILFTLGRQALIVRDDQAAAFVLTPPIDGLVLLAISHSGETQFPLQLVQEARAGGIPTIGLSNEPASELAREVEVLLPTQAVESPRGSYAIAPRICQLAVLDALFMRLRQAGVGDQPGVGHGECSTATAPHDGDLPGV
jgi:DNA-binding MurR/RpiR family transcriptional regulator